jgi:hypothetical protein
MSIRKPLPILLAASLLAGGLASATPVAAAVANAPKASRACFTARSVYSYRVVNPTTVNVGVSPKTVFQLTLFSPSSDIDWTQSIGIEARGSDWICAGMDATVIVPSPIGPQRFPVTQVRKLTPEEVTALSPKARP